RMLRRQALIRKLPAVETLGSVTVICSDNTGTLTENRMTVKVIDVAGKTQNVLEMIRRGSHVLSRDQEQLKPELPPQTILLAGGALCTDALLQYEDDEHRNMVTVGDPTEGALLVAAGRYGMWKEDLEEGYPRVAEVPFESSRKRMTTIHPLDASDRAVLDGQRLEGLVDIGDAKYVGFTKGAVDRMLNISSRVWAGDQIHEMTDEWRERVNKANEDLAKDGLRVLGFAFRLFDELPDTSEVSNVEDELTFVGMVGMVDPPRPEVAESVSVAKVAGIRPVMITGDHPLTAQYIARDLGIATNDRVLTGLEVAKMDDKALQGQVEHVDVFARVAPEHKLNIVQALRDKGHIVAMTGDGVNDAPALRKADIGVAMGITGTAVSKEASEMVILDDNFTTIVRAVEEGRTIYDNVRRFIKYILASNTGEVFVLLGTQSLGLPLPLSTLQILYMNLVTDGVPALALAIEPTEKGAMKRPPYAPNESIFARGMLQHLIIVGAIIFAASFGLSLIGYDMLGNPAEGTTNFAIWQTMVFTTLVLSQMGHALSVRSNTEYILSPRIFTNMPLLLSVGLTTLFQLLLIYLPPFQNFFGTAPLTLEQLGICLGLSFLVTSGIEIRKLIINLTNKEA
ncbi:MAG: cation-transporting P-type ATPase, partial [Chloroflexi bacterium]|nr:cation-transporting P-type ATPase [Chloroflexota bacterium]